MGIGLSTIELLSKLRRAGYLTPGGAVVEVGAQQLGSSCFAHPEGIAELGRLFGAKQPLPVPSLGPALGAVDDGAQVISFAAPFARDFWRWLGFDYAAIDIDGSPESIPLDLNYDSVPGPALSKYDIVTNFGTTEHVANQLNAFKVIHDLTARNGIMIHEVPTQGMLNHGLVNYNFKFFWLLIRSNGYKAIHADFLPARDYQNLPDNIRDFLNSSKLETGSWDGDYRAADAGMLIVVQKLHDSEFVAPLDVDTGATTEIEALKQRYWTVFEPDPFERLKMGAKTLDALPAGPDSPLETAPGKGVSADPGAVFEAAAGKGVSTHPGAVFDTSAEQGISARSPDQPTIHIRRGGIVTRVLGILRRMVTNSDKVAEKIVEIIHGIANQSDLTRRQTQEISLGISNQSDLMRRNMEAILRVMTELRDIQKAQLFMQRSAAEAIKQSTMGAAGARPAGKQSGNA